VRYHGLEEPGLSPPTATSILEFHSPEGPVVKHVRSTLISSSVQTLRENKLFDRYLTYLPKEFHEAVLLTIAPTWMPVEVAMAHYGSCDALNLAESELERIGESVSSRIMGTFLGTLVRSSRNVGATPLIPLRQYDRLLSRLMSGGSCIVKQTGPKDAVVQSHGVPMFEYRYFRVAYQGVVRGSIGMFAKKVLTRSLHGTGGNPHVAFTGVSWV
jgi:hypothetical protein